MSKVRTLLGSAAVAAGLVFTGTAAASAQPADGNPGSLLPTVSLVAEFPNAPVGGSVTLTATSSSPISPGEELIVTDMTTGRSIAVCRTNPCVVHVAYSIAVTHKYRAVLKTLLSPVGSPLHGSVSVSSPQYVTWSAASGWTMAFSAVSYPGYTIVSAEVNHSVTRTPYAIHIYEATSGAIYQTCTTGTACSVRFNSGGIFYPVAFIDPDKDASLPISGAVMNSGTFTVIPDFA